MLPMKQHAHSFQCLSLALKTLKSLFVESRIFDENLEAIIWEFVHKNNTEKSKARFSFMKIFKLLMKLTE